MKANLHLTDRFLYKFGTAGDLAEACRRPYWVGHRQRDPEPGSGGIMLALERKKKASATCSKVTLACHDFIQAGLRL